MKEKGGEGSPSHLTTGRKPKKGGGGEDGGKSSINILFHTLSLYAQDKIRTYNLNIFRVPLYQLSFLGFLLNF